MEVTPTRPTPELNHLVAAALQGSRFKERRQREADSDVQNQVVYFSPVIRIDPETQNVVIQYRDSETGDILNQYPNLPEKVSAYLHTAQTADAEIAAIPVITEQNEQTAPVSEAARSSEQSGTTNLLDEKI